MTVDIVGVTRFLKGREKTVVTKDQAVRVFVGDDVLVVADSKEELRTKIRDQLIEMKQKLIVEINEELLRIADEQESQ